MPPTIPGAVLAALLLTGCAAMPAPPAIALGNWQVTAIDGRPTPPAPGSYRMTFAARTLGGQFGCNHFGGEYRVAGEVLTTSAMMMTEMACGEPAASFESQGMAVLLQPARITWRDAGGFRLSNAAGSIEINRR